MTLVTNGTRLTPDFIARLGKLPISISVSLGSLDRDTYRRIRGRDQLPRVLAGLELLAEFSGTKYLTCIVSEANRDDSLGAAAFARKIGFLPIFGAYHWDVKAYGKRDAELIFARQGAMAVFEKISASGLVPKGYFREYLKDNLPWLAGEKLTGFDAGRRSIAIDTSGNVAPCLGSINRATCGFKVWPKFWRPSIGPGSRPVPSNPPVIFCAAASSAPLCAARSPALEVLPAANQIRRPMSTRLAAISSASISPKGNLRN